MQPVGFKYMLIKNAFILKENFKFERSNVEFTDKIANFASNFALETVDAQGMLLIPGLIDVHTHGAVGFGYPDMNRDSYAAMTAYYAANAVTSFLLATMSLPQTELVSRLRGLAELMEQPHSSAYPQGIYLEGAFINPEKSGSHNPADLLKPDSELFAQFMDAARGHIKVLAVAPELENALPFIEAAAKQVVVSLAHTKADYEIANKAIELGATNATHLFNAMSPIAARDPGVIGAVIDNDKVFVELIVDGGHLHKSIVRMAFKMCGENRVLLVSDSVAVAGLGVGSYSAHGRDITVLGNSARLSDGRLAGSAVSLLDCVKKCTEIGISLEQAIKAASWNPARMLGVDKLTGSISIGKFADLVLLDRELNVKMVFVKGQLVYNILSI